LPSSIVFLTSADCLSWLKDCWLRISPHLLLSNFANIFYLLWSLFLFSMHEVW
jgi:hypothetical protein